MAVIDTSMDFPSNCYGCEKRNYCQLARGNGWLCDKRDDFCPLRSADEMIAEIKGYCDEFGWYDGDLSDLSDDFLSIIYKYCGEGKTNEN